jgi:hypothetical protein
MITLILYTRVGCCLCEGLEQRLRELLPPEERLPKTDARGVLERIHLHTVEVDSDPDLQARYGLSVPVLAVATEGDGAITPLPPLSPRLQGEPLRRWLLRHLGPEPPV